MQQLLRGYVEADNGVIHIIDMVLMPQSVGEFQVVS
jgi:uncharacterized surface protein with fasciclin (FAS1) repeats